MDREHTVYDPRNGHRMELVSYRHDGNGLYRDLEDGSSVVCHPHMMALYPPAKIPFRARTIIPPFPEERPFYIGKNVFDLETLEALGGMPGTMVTI